MSEPSGGGGAGPGDVLRGRAVGVTTNPTPVPSGAAPSNIHVIDQSGQPYGSERRCCNRCGAMAVPGMWIVHSIAEWNELPEEQRCKL